MPTSDDPMEPEEVQKSEAVRGFWKRWKRVGKKIGDFQARALLSIFYYIIFAPFALVVRWMSDPLAIKPGSSRGWQVRREDSPTERANRQS